MQRNITILLLLSVFSVTLFGLTSMHTHGTDSNPRCLASMFSQADAPCPQEDPIGFASYHLDAFQTFSLAVFSDGLIVAFLAVLSMLFLSIQPFSLAYILIERPFNRISDSPIHFASRRILNWFSIHENSPSFI